MASWWRPDLDMGFTADFGSLAFGVPTPEGAVPLTGSATYQGVVSGWTDAKFSDSSGHFPLYSAEGTVALDFNFGTGTLGGRMVLSLPAGGMNPIEVGSYAFRQTIFSAGRTTYSGSFDTSLTGLNFFNGRFTGPAAQETIGHWAVPFTFDTVPQSTRLLFSVKKQTSASFSIVSSSASSMVTIFFLASTAFTAAPKAGADTADTSVIKRRARNFTVHSDR